MDPQEAMSELLAAQRHWLAAVRAKNINALLRGSPMTSLSSILTVGQFEGLTHSALISNDFSGSSNWSNLPRLKRR